MVKRALRLGVNIDHVATIRNARGGRHPDPVRAARLAAQAGADGITAHLREDRRHISDADIDRLTREIDLPLNLEMAATSEMLAIALAHMPNAACIVPEKRAERTTEGGLDVAGNRDGIRKVVKTLKDAEIVVSLFIDPDVDQVRAAHRVEADVVEIHTGRYCDARLAQDRRRELARVIDASKAAAKLGIQVAAGHGLNYQNVLPVAAISEIEEFNIGHAIVSRAVLVGMERAVREMKDLIAQGARG